MRNWNRGQHEAINDRGRNLLVSAGAGSGKTAVLVERIIQILSEDLVDLDKLLVVTFTQAAAAEMRERISDALLGRIASGQGSQEHLRRQLHLLGSASISTIHAFCGDVLRRYFHVLELDPHFRVSDENEARLIKDEALEELLEKEYQAAHPLFHALVEMFSSNKNDLGLAEVIKILHSFIHSLPRPWEWLGEQVGAFDSSFEDFLAGNWMRELSRQLNEPLIGIRSLLTAALGLAEGDGALKGYQATLEMDLANLSCLEEAMERGLPAFFLALNSTVIPRLGRAGKDADPATREQVKALRDQGKNHLVKLKKAGETRSISDWHTDLKRLHPYMEYLYTLVRSFEAIYSARKRVKNLLDFNDLEHFCLQTLQNPAVAGELRKKYRYIFVDEYQDSNLVQEEIIQSIWDEDNLFLVGDVKQSIYRFRLADPTLFLQKYREYANEQESPRHHRIDLSLNYRSTPIILDSINTIFRCIMSESLGELDYNADAFLYPGADYQAQECGEEASVEALILEKQLDNNTPDEWEELERAEIEARAVAGRIRELIRQPYYDSRGNLLKDLQYKDIVILLRATRSWGPVMWQTLTEQGIPAFADMNTGYFEAIEIQVVLNLLRLIDNRRQDIPLLSVMRSPIGGFSMEELALIKASFPGLPYHEAVMQYALQDDRLGVKLAEFFSRLEKWQEKANYLAVDQLIWELIHETAYYYYLGALPGGEQRQGNLRLLIDRARQFQQTSFSGLFHFLGYLDQIEQGSGDLGVARTLNENENLVRIMSIHKSKGLEFPVVIIPGLGRQFNRQDSTATFLLHRRLGLGPRFVDLEKRTYRDTLARQVIAARISREGLAEEMRILYVAMTRAKNRLILAGSLDNLPRCAAKWAGPLDPFTLSHGGCFLDWLGPVLLRHRDGEALRQLIPDSYMNEGLLPDQSKIKISVCSSADVISLCSGSVSPDPPPGLAAQNTAPDLTEPVILERLNWNYPHEQAARIPSKIAASHLWRINLKPGQAGRLEPDIPTLRRIPLFYEGDQKPPVISGMLRGTLTHLVMQHLDLNQVAEGVPIESLITAMVQGELLSEEEASYINCSQIAGFFSSDLGQRVLKADRVYRELPFNLQRPARLILQNCEYCDDNLLVQGVIDLCFVEGEELVLLDYKTDQIFTPEELAGATDRYRIQLELYRAALESLLQLKVKESYLYFLTPGRWLQV
ncbi:MAG: helicase-exonuclease AddAB subunit AddA [Syntrophomonadaceae bacterium]